MTSSPGTFIDSVPTQGPAFARLRRGKRGRPRPVFAIGIWLLAMLALTCHAAEPTVFRAARSVHLSYPAPEGLLFYNETVVEQSVNGSYFMACGWNTGYFGIQQLGEPDKKVVLFSVWDPGKGDDPNAVKTEDRVDVLCEGEGLRIKRFGGEGTGGQCMWDYAWHVGETNRFIIHAKIEGPKTSYTAWFYANDMKAWKKLAEFRTRTGGLALRGYYSFIEDFRRDGKSVGEVRRARFGNGWVKTTKGEWTPLNKARFTASNAEWESKENINAGVENGSFFLATGGDVKRTCELRSTVELAGGAASSPKLVVPLPAEVEEH
jgi:hypothetical protein